MSNVLSVCVRYLIVMKAMMSVKAGFLMVGMNMALL